MDKSPVPWKHITSISVAVGGLIAVIILATIGAVHDGETTSAIATVLTSAVAIHHSRKEDNDNGG